MDIEKNKREFKREAGDNNSQFKQPREVDSLVKNINRLMGRTFVFIRTTRVKTWQAVFIIAFCAGAAAAVIWTVSLEMQTSSDAVTPVAALSLVSSSSSVQINDTFTVEARLKTNNNEVVVAKAVVNYNKDDFQLMSYSMAGGLFGSISECPANSEQIQALCAKIDNNSAAGKFTITLPKPTPGVKNTAFGKIATLTFKAKRAVAPVADNITIGYTSGSYDDSDVILDNGTGTDILSGSGAVTHARVAVGSIPATMAEKIFWKNNAESLRLWSVDSDNNFITSKELGPLASWTAVNYAKADDDTGRLLYNHDSGQVGLWKLNSADDILSYKTHSVSGWTALKYTSGANGTGGILLKHNTNGQFAFWGVNDAGTIVAARAYSPVAGWTPIDLTLADDGTGRILWKHDSGRQFGLWKIDSAGVYLTAKAYGVSAGWTASAYISGANGTGEILWKHDSGQVGLWKLNSADAPVSYKAYGPIAGWTAVDYAQADDGTGTLLWKSNSGQVGLWKLNSADVPVSYKAYTSPVEWDVISLSK